MYAFSPGLWSDSGHDMWAWSLVAVDTMNGAVTKQCDIAPRGMTRNISNIKLQHSRNG
ncbi:hypothetical protein DPMN_053247 [Dreissena polymorpha]|uniref:Uncharacterized protein n=1 Tax=Dreissena polymorpha TaxID=45954 RepID=A0A9D4HQH5_DREPO|nr:hypothetical protein DPMN_053247 [Dreissena polymorpha]